MAFNSEMWRTEELHRFRDNGILSGHGVVVVGNAGIAAKYNPIPAILENLLEHPCVQNRRDAHFAISWHLQKKLKLNGSDSADAANDVIDWYLDPNCHACTGTGLKNIEQETCPVCLGMKKYPEWSVGKSACMEIEGLFVERERQLRALNAG